VVKGKLIVIEGADGAGKSTLQRALAAHLSAQGTTVVQSREPTNGPNGMAIRQAAQSQRLSPEKELELLLLDRRAHVAELIAPALARGDWVILDRYYFSTIAYQGAAGLDLAMLQAVNEAFAPRPDALLLLDLPVETSLQRIQARGLASDEFERPITLKRVREIFLGFSALPYATVLDARLTPGQLLIAARHAIARA
jgi:dTMP kinase